MKTLSTTLAIFALLLSTTAFSSVGSGEITPPIRNDRPGIELNKNNNLNEINSPISNDRLGINI